MPLSNVLRHDLMSKTLGCWIRGGLYVVKYILPWSDSFAIFLKSRRKEKARGVVTFLSPLVVFSPDVGVDFLPPIRRRWRNAFGCRWMGTSSICFPPFIQTVVSVC
jgi:hypothetical protein